MLGLVIKSSVAFCASYVVLSFQINNVSLFERLNQFTGPVGQNIQSALGESFDRTWEKTQELGGQLFTNSEPKAVQDHVDKTQSAIKKKLAPPAKHIKNTAESYLEDLRKEERDDLSRIISSD
ncbi:MAG: hypothetical protein WD025_00310 [Bacteriovoracaceae bacterium]